VRLHSGWARLLVLSFVGAILVPGAVLLSGGEGAAPAENRTLAPPPTFALDAATLRAWPAAASRYFADHFGLRGPLVRWQATMRLRLFGVSASPDVILGRDGWLFYAGDGGREDLASAVPLTDAELRVWCATLQHTSDWLRARGITYLFVIAPDKHVIYPEYLPASVRRVGAETRIDALVRDLRAHTTVPVLDLRPGLLAAKASERVYHRTDTHWNDRGAFVAYREILGALGPVAGSPAARDAFTAPQRRMPGMDLARMLGLSAELPEDDLPLVPRQPRRARVVEPAHPDPLLMDGRVVTVHDDTARPRAVVFRDSFGSAAIPFLAEHFSRAVFLWQYNMDPAVVEAERPQVVIQEWVGRRLETLLPYDPFSGGQK
jgi:hypothetical protein